MDGMMVEEAAAKIVVTTAQVRLLVHKGRIAVKQRMGSLLLLDPGDVEREAKRSSEARDWIARVERM